MLWLPIPLVARLIAYFLEFAEGIEFSRGVSSPDESTIAVRDLTGALSAWIDIGTPDAERLHKASKIAGRVAVCAHKDPTQLLKQLAGGRAYDDRQSVERRFGEHRTADDPIAPPSRSTGIVVDDVRRCATFERPGDARDRAIPASLLLGWLYRRRGRTPLLAVT